MSETTSTKPVLIEWDSQAFGLCVPEMDETHADFIDLVNQLDTAPNSEFAGLFARLFEHTQAHLEEEKARMQNATFRPWANITTNTGACSANSRRSRNRSTRDGFHLGACM